MLFFYRLLVVELKCRVVKRTCEWRQKMSILFRSTLPKSRHDARAVANYLIGKSFAANRRLTPLQIMKLIYFSHAWMLAIFERPLFKQNFEAWKYGPVVPEVYQALKLYSRSPITSKISLDNSTEHELDVQETAILDKVFDEYSTYNGWILSGLTHIPEGPWFQARVEKGLGSTIPNRAIQTYYAKRRKSRVHSE